MSSTRDRARLALCLALAATSGCGLVRPPDPPPFECATIDRAAERFPDECGEPAPEDDAGTPEEDAPTDERGMK